jgi:signal transduction histidine kinase
LEKNGILEVFVEDDGVGFDLGFQDGKTVKNGGFGLFSIQESMIDLGGAFHIRSEPGRGCIAILKLPIEKIQKVGTDEKLSGSGIIQENPIEDQGLKYGH